MSIAILWATITFVFKPVVIRAQSENIPYCNKTYHFCARYPTSQLPFKAFLPGKKGIFLKSKDGFAEVTIRVYRQPGGKDTKTLFLESARKISALQKEPKIISSLFGEDFYECFFMAGLHYYYHQSYHFADHFVRLEIKVPINKPGLMAILRTQVSLEFQTPDKGESTSLLLTGEEIGSWSKK